LDKLEDGIEAREALGAVAAHVAAADPHPGYLTQAEGDSRYRQSATALTDGDIPAGIARDSEVAAAIGAHEAAADPHPGYLTAAEGNAAYATAAQGTLASTAIQPGNAALTDARTPTAHKSTHATGGSDALTPADIGAATAAQGAKADTAVQPGSLGTAAATAATDYAPAAQGVTNGNSHNHDGGDGAQIAYASLSGLPSIPSTYSDLGPLGDGLILVLSNKGETATAGTNYVEWPVPVPSGSFTLTAVRFGSHIDNTGSSSSTFNAYKRTSAGTKTSVLTGNATLASGASLVDASASLIASPTFTAGDRIGVDLIGVGTGAQGLFAQFLFTRSAV
jgi:hypothetical protein